MDFAQRRMVSKPTAHSSLSAWVEPVLLGIIQKAQSINRSYEEVVDNKASDC